jgi:hypothetical protein
MKCLGLHNKPTAEVHPGHMLTGPKEEKEINCSLLGCGKSLHCTWRDKKYRVADKSLACTWRDKKYRVADKSLARPGRKQATATEDFEFHISYL